MKVSGITATISLLLLVIVVGTLSLTLTLGVGIGVGWVLTLFLPFSLFEASLLGLIASVIVGAFWYNILSTMPSFGSDEFDEFEDEEYYDPIPVSRFFKSETDKTWEAWVRYQLANDIYAEFQEQSHPIVSKGEKQAQELAIRLADVVIPLLKTKSPKVKRLNVNLATVKRQMNKMGQRPYDDDLLHPAIMAVNWNLDYNYENVMRINREKLWNAPCDLFAPF